jgi:hypothetical protein
MIRCGHLYSHLHCRCPRIEIEERRDSYMFPGCRKTKCSTCSHAIEDDAPTEQKKGVMLLIKDAGDGTMNPPTIHKNTDSVLLHLKKHYKLGPGDLEQLYLCGGGVIVEEDDETWSVHDGRELAPKGSLEVDFINKFDDMRQAPPELVEIYYQDLSLEKQAQMLELHGIEHPGQMNWEVIPLFTAELPEIEVPSEEVEEKVSKKRKGRKTTPPKTQAQVEEPDEEDDEDDLDEDDEDEDF